LFFNFFLRLAFLSSQSHQELKVHQFSTLKAH
jgi:hypothetical protein